MGEETTQERHGGGRRVAEADEGAELGGVLQLLPLDLRHAVEEAAVRGTQLRIAGDRIAELSLGVTAPRHVGGIEQPVPYAAVSLLRVSQREDLVAEVALLRLFGVLVVILLQQVGAAAQVVENGLVLNLAAKVELRDRLQAARAPRVADHEHGLPVVGALLAPLEVVLGPQRLAVGVVYPVEGHVEVVARVGEVVGIAAEEPDLQLRRHDHPQVGVAPEDVGRVPGSIPERD